MGTAYFSKGKTFAAGDAVSAAALHQLVEDATMQPAHITGLTAKTTTVAADRVMISDSAASNELKQVTLANLIPAGSITPAKLDTTKAFNAYSFRIGPSDDHNWVWMPGGSNNLVLQETTSAGVALDPYKIPIQVAEGTANNTLYLNSTGIGVLTSSPAYPLDVTGLARATGVIVRDTIPQITLDDSSASAYPVALYTERTGGATWLYMSLLPAVGGAASKTPVSLCMDASDNTLVLTSTSRVGIGTASPAYTLDVAGSLHCSAGLYLGASATPTGSSAGTAGQIAWDASYLYVCTATNTWKRAALSSF